jgi:hypothetical protein
MLNAEGNATSLLFDTRAQNGSALCNEILNGLITVQKIAGKLATPTVDYDTLHPNVCRIWVLGGGQDWLTWQEAVKGIGEKLRDFRHLRKPDYADVKDAIQGKSQTARVERVVFGLPLRFQYRSLDRPNNNAWIAGKYERRASPLHLKVAKLANGNYLGVAVLFKSAFLPKGEKLKAKNARVSLPQDYTLIESFIQTQFPNHWEVTGW